MMALTGAAALVLETRATVPIRSVAKIQLKSWWQVNLSMKFPKLALAILE